MKVFSENDRSADDGKTILYSETTFHYTDRSSRQEAERVRSLLEQLLSEYPEIHQNRIQGRLRSDDERDFISAVFELVVHGILLRLGYSPQVEPDINGKKPEFLCSIANKEQCLVECATVFGLDDREYSHILMKNRILDRINEIQVDDYFLMVEALSWPNQLPKFSKINEYIDAFIESLDYDAICAECLRDPDRILEIVPSTQTPEYTGLVIKFRAFPKKDEARSEDTHSAIGAIRTPIHLIDNVSPIRARLKEKAHKYGYPKIPYIICINALDYANGGLGPDMVDFYDVLFSKRDMFFRPDMNTRVSAVIFFRDLKAWNLGRVESGIICNPWANNPTGDWFNTWTQFSVENEELVALEGATIQSTLGLNPAWPEENSSAAIQRLLQLFK
jgi:hypothetical protein